MPDNIQKDLDGGTDEARSALTLVLNETDGGMQPARRQAKEATQIRAARLIMYVMVPLGGEGAVHRRVTVKTIECSSRCQTNDAESDEVLIMVV